MYEKIGLLMKNNTHSVMSTIFYGIHSKCGARLLSLLPDMFEIPVLLLKGRVSASIFYLYARTFKHRT